jgi:phosphonate transport system ATP-binding protein
MLCSSTATNATGPVSPVITLDGVTKRFHNTVALSQISATIPPGQFIAIIGRSGAGKTTLLHCLSRGTVVTEGSVCFGPCDLATLQGEVLRQHRARVGMIYQQFNLVKRLRVLDNVLIGRLPHLRRMSWWFALGCLFSPDDQQVALRCLDHVGLLSRAWQHTATLSGGEQQRVAIAKVLAQEPHVILADEPVASLDLMNSTLVMDTLRRIVSETGLTVIATLHHVEYARRYADRVLGLRAGELVFDGPPSALTHAPLHSLFGASLPLYALPEPAVTHGSARGASWVESL